MSKVLLVCPEPLGHRHPAGVGIRFLEVARCLLTEGHTVSLLSPDGGQIAGCHCLPITPQSLHDISSRSDAAMVQGHAANDYFTHAVEIPTVVDLYDPFIIENLHYFETHGDEVFRHDHETLLTSLRRGDFFLCASQAQRFFYLGALLTAGRLNPEAFVSDPSLESLIAIVPFGVPPPLDRSGSSPASHRVLFGGIYDWYDPILAIDAVAAAREAIPDMTLSFTEHPNPSLTPQSAAARARDYVRRHHYDSFVEFQPWAPYDERISYFGSFGAALITFPRSIETELAMRTRIFDYLWAGLPIVTSSAPGTDSLVKEHENGTVVESSSPKDFAKALVQIIGDPSLHARMSENASRWSESHQWPILLKPLLEFFRHPRRDASKPPDSGISLVPARGRSFLARVRRRLRSQR